MNPIMRDALRVMFRRAASDWSERTFCAGWYTGLHEPLRAEARYDMAWLIMAYACDGWPGDDDDEWLPLTELETRVAVAVLGGFVLPDTTELDA